MIKNERYGKKGLYKKHQTRKPGIIYYLSITLAIAGILSFQNCSFPDKSVASQTHSNVSR